MRGERGELAGERPHGAVRLADRRAGGGLAFGLLRRGGEGGLDAGERIAPGGARGRRGARRPRRCGRRRAAPPRAGRNPRPAPRARRKAPPALRRRAATRRAIRCATTATPRPDFAGPRGFDAGVEGDELGLERQPFDALAKFEEARAFRGDPSSAAAASPSAARLRAIAARSAPALRRASRASAAPPTPARTSASA